MHYCGGLKTPTAVTNDIFPLSKNIEEGGRDTMMIQRLSYHHKFKFIINLINFNSFFGQELILRKHQRRKTGKQQITGRLLALSVLAINLNLEAGRRLRENKESSC